MRASRSAGPVGQASYSPVAAGRETGTLARLAGVALIGLALSGCASISLPMGSLFDSDKDEDVVTGSIVRPANAARLPETDWKVAQGALGSALVRSEAGASVPWSNPATGAHGTVTPLSASNGQPGQTCRNFLLSHVQGGAETWHQGEACRQPKGVWEALSVRPLHKNS